MIITVIIIVIIFTSLSIYVSLRQIKNDPTQTTALLMAQYKTLDEVNDAIKENFDAIMAYAISQAQQQAAQNAAIAAHNAQIAQANATIQQLQNQIAAALALRKSLDTLG